ncbi:MAG TPA: hypothetical protein VE093_07635 [Polyangiaceae bacterium]|nr:hypothetical protein [Polyangiaceae bacterium]
MIPAASALRAGAAALLDARGEGDLAKLVASADVEVVGPQETWAMGSRSVAAHRVALVVDASVFAALTADALKVDAVRGAFAAAMRTPETELADLSVVLRLPSIQKGWHRAYRDAPRQSAEAEGRDPDAVLGGAAALLDTMGEEMGAGLLRRGRLEAADVPGGSFPPLVRYVLRLDAADFAAAKRDPFLAERMKRALQAAGTRATEAVASVDFAAALLSWGSMGVLSPVEARLVRALEGIGATVVPVARGIEEGEVTLAVVLGGEVRVVEVVAGDGDAREIDARVSSVRVRRAAQVRWMLVPAASLEDEAGAMEAASAACEGMVL